jgi:hypothetical protein
MATLTKARDGLIDQAAYIVLVSHIGAQKFGLSAELAEFSDQLLAFIIVSTRDNEAHSLMSEGQCRGATHARQGAGNKDNGWVLEGVFILFYGVAWIESR